MPHLVAISSLRHVLEAQLNFHTYDNHYIVVNPAILSGLTCETSSEPDPETPLHNKLAPSGAAFHTELRTGMFILPYANMPTWQLCSMATGEVIARAETSEISETPTSV